MRILGPRTGWRFSSDCDNRAAQESPLIIGDRFKLGKADEASMSLRPLMPLCGGKRFPPGMGSVKRGVRGNRSSGC